MKKPKNGQGENNRWPLTSLSLPLTGRMIYFFIKNVLVRKDSARAMSTGSGGKKRRGMQIWRLREKGFVLGSFIWIQLESKGRAKAIRIVSAHKWPLRLQRRKGLLRSKGH